jgi:DNA repair photolyase
MAFRVLTILFEWNIGVSFLTKGRIPQRHMDLLKANASLVQAQIGLTTIDEEILGMFEPQAAPPQVRLDQARQLAEAGIATTGRLDPILPGLTDDETSLRNACPGFAEAGITTQAASTLFLRPAITGSLRKSLRDASVRTRLFDAFNERSRLAIHAESSSITALPQETRQATFERLRAIAAEFGITVRICACKNPDIDNGVCHIAGRSSNATNPPAQARLFE